MFPFQVYCICTVLHACIQHEESLRGSLFEHVVWWTCRLGGTSQPNTLSVVVSVYTALSYTKQSPLQHRNIYSDNFHH